MRSKYEKLKRATNEMMRKHALPSLMVGSLVMLSSAQADPILDFQLDYEGTAYFEESAQDQTGRVKKQRFNHSIAAELEYYRDWDDGDRSITFKPFVRLDEADEERTHADIRELIIHQLTDEFEIKVGIGKVFWGVTESQHLVDIVNQTDAVEQLDGEAKLGQPMVQVLLERDWGNLDTFILPYHRERTFTGPDGRLSSGLSVAEPFYQAEEEERHIDFAVRYSNYWDELELALSYFQGNSREPALGAYVNTDNSIETLTYYPLIQQTGLELQYLYEGWAWKFEGIYRTGMPKIENGQSVRYLESLDLLTVEGDEAYSATTAGFEYTQVGINESRVDLGWVIEHLYDSRGNDASFVSAEHDLLLATRWAMNDAEDTTLLAGVLYDYEYEDHSLSIEGSTRLGEGLSAEIEARIFSPSRENQLQYAFRNEDFLKFTLSYFY